MLNRKSVKNSCSKEPRSASQNIPPVLRFSLILKVILNNVHQKDWWISEAWMVVFQKRCGFSGVVVKSCQKCLGTFAKSKCMPTSLINMPRILENLKIVWWVKRRKVIKPQEGELVRAEGIYVQLYMHNPGRINMPAGSDASHSICLIFPLYLMPGTQPSTGSRELSSAHWVTFTSDQVIHLWQHTHTSTVWIF